MAEIELTETYVARSVRFLELWEPAGWRMKVYGIAYNAEVPRPELVTAAKKAAVRQLTRNAPRQAHYGVGFVVIHDGRGANLVLVDWWANENELHHHVYISASDEPESLHYVAPSGPIGCVWDLVVLCAERQAWVETVLDNPDGPDLDAYLTRRVEGLY